MIAPACRTAARASSNAPRIAESTSALSSACASSFEWLPRARSSVVSQRRIASGTGVAPWRATITKHLALVSAPPPSAGVIESPPQRPVRPSAVSEPEMEDANGPVRLGEHCLVVEALQSAGGSLCLDQRCLQLLTGEGAHVGAPHTGEGLEAGVAGSRGFRDGSGEHVLGALELARFCQRVTELGQQLAAGRTVGGEQLDRAAEQAGSRVSVASIERTASSLGQVLARPRGQIMPVLVEQTELAAVTKRLLEVIAEQLLTLAKIARISPGCAACSSRAATLTASPVASRSSVPVTTSPVFTPVRSERVVP